MKKFRKLVIFILLLIMFSLIAVLIMQIYNLMQREKYNMTDIIEKVELVNYLLIWLGKSL